MENGSFRHQGVKPTELFTAVQLVLIEDLGSTNGTFVNGEKVKQARLKEGDRILIGTSILKLVVSSKIGDTTDAQVRANLEAAAKATEAPKPKPAKAPKAPKPAKAAEPVHTHPLDQKPEGECAVCESHGNPLEAESAAQMFRAEPVGLQDRLQAIIAGAADSDADSDAESESEGEEPAPPSAGGLSEEEFESEDEQ